MERYNKILINPLFKKAMSIIDENEKTRIFCCHGIEHILDVARIAYILNFENNLNIPKDVIYAAALLHDTGRAESSLEHSKSSALLAAEILPQCGYSVSETKEITSAILNHRHDTQTLNNLSDIICKADKLSRQCYNCKAQPECYWESERRNKSIKY